MRIFQAFQFGLCAPLVFLSSLLHAADTHDHSFYERIRFEHLDLESGLSQNTVNSIAKDPMGFFWFATEDGLNRFDGFRIRTFRQDVSGGGGLSDAFINDLHVDGSGNLWIGTNKNGVDLYDPKLERFVNLKPSQIPKSWENNIVVIDQIREGSLLIGSENGLFVLDTGTLKFTLLDLPRDKNNERIVVRDFTSTHEHLFVAAESAIYRVHLESLEAELLFETDRSERLYTSIEMTQGFLYVGSSQGLRIFEEATLNEIQLPESFTRRNLDLATINSFEIDPEGSLWIATVNGLGIYCFQHDHLLWLTDEFEKIQLNDNHIVSMVFVDGMAWIGTKAAGVHYWNSEAKPFENYSVGNGAQASLSDNVVRSVFETSDGSIWVGMNHGKIDVIRSDRIDHFDLGELLKTEDTIDYITAIAEDEASLWLGTWGNGTFQIGKRKNEDGIQLDPSAFNRYLAKDETPFTSDRIQTIYVDSMGARWIASEFDGATISVGDEFFQISEALSDARIQSNCILEDDMGNFWIGTWDGLNYLQWHSRPRSEEELTKYLKEESYTVHHFDNSGDDRLRLSDTRILGIALCENSKCLAMGTYGGGVNVVDYTVRDGVFEVTSVAIYSHENALSNNIVYSVEWHDKALWAKTNHGLNKIDTESGRVATYFREDGIAGNQFFWGGSHKAADGKLYFGGIEGLTTFYPDQILESIDVPEVHLTNLEIFNLPVEPGMVVGGKIPLTQSISSTEAIELNHELHSFTFHFSAFNINSFANIRFAYRLKGFTDEWTITDRRYAQYTNIHPGSYVFEVYASNSDGVWSDSVKRLALTIPPPYYQTVWFRILVAFSLVALLVWAYLRRTHMHRVQRQMLKQQVELQTQQLTESNEQLVKAQEEIRRERNELSVTLESISEGVVTTDQCGVIRLCNNIIAEIFDQKTSDIEGQLFQSLLNAEDPKITQQIVDLYAPERAMEDGYVRIRQINIRTLSGDAKIISISAAPLSNRYKGITGMVYVVRDITEALKQESQIALSQKMESIGQLAAGIAHEINTPMQYIGDNNSFVKDAFENVFSYSQELERLMNEGGCVAPEKIDALKDEKDIEFFVDEVPSALEQTSKGITYVSKIIRAMKDFSHSSRGTKVDTDINGAVETTITISANEWKYYAELESDLQPGLPMVKCIEDEIKQVLLNMIINAAHATEERYGNTREGRISIRTVLEEGFVKIVIGDNGTGIKEENLKKIFDQFFTTKKVGKGTGQGLSIAHDIIVNKHGGKIDVRSEFGVGTEFHILLPV
jgi:PAS domain S-box-containing protein